MLLSDYHRKLLYFRFDQQATENLKIGVNVRYNNTLQDGAGTSNAGSSSLNFLRNIIRYRPFLAPGQSDNTNDEAYASETNANSLSLVNPVLLNQATVGAVVQATVQRINGKLAVIALNGMVAIRKIELYDGKWHVEGRDQSGKRVEMQIDPRTGTIAHLERFD